jgi:hypothetical protein
MSGGNKSNSLLARGSILHLLNNSLQEVFLFNTCDYSEDFILDTKELSVGS